MVNKSVRKYEERDLTAVIATWEDASKLSHPFLSHAFIEQERHDIEHVYLPNTETWVYESEGQVVGFIALIDNEVGAIFVQPALHGKGIGRQLMDKAQAIHGILEVDVFEENLIGRRFYEKYGFEYVSKNAHEATGQNMLRLRFVPEPDDT